MKAADWHTLFNEMDRQAFDLAAEEASMAEAEADRAYAEWLKQGMPLPVSGFLSHYTGKRGLFD